MDVAVVLERVEGNGYRATAFAPAPLVAEASTREEAMDKLRDMICEKLSSAELVQLRIPELKVADPWLAYAGVWRDNPDVAEIEENMKEYRRAVDADSDRP
ncbi:MAG: hypothetical protein OES79_00795 [Planctomycetota bacterium]|nr:hypothetical protein [Planctomycetota bacterium]